MQSKRPEVADAFSSLVTRPQLSWIFLLVGLLISAIASWTCYHLIAQEQQARLNVRVEQGQSALELSLYANIEVLRGLQSHFLSRAAVDDRQTFHDYYRFLELEQRYPALQALSFVRWLLPEQVDEFIARTRADRSLTEQGYPDFEIKPAGARDVYCVVDLLEPLTINTKVFGLDLCSEPDRRAMIERARDSGELAVSGPLILFNTEPRAPGFILALPVYRPNAPLSNPAERRAAFLGVVTGVFYYQQLIAGALGTAFLQEGAVKVYDLPPGQPDTPNNRQQIFANANASRTPLAAQASIAIDDRHWQLAFAQPPGVVSLADRALPPLVGLIGLLLSGRVFARLRQLQLQGTKATARARASEQRLASVVASLPDLIWSVDLPQLNLHYLSPAALSLLGPQQASQALGKPWQSLLHADDHALLADWYQGVLSGGQQTLEVRLLRADGGLCWLELRGHVVRDDAGLPMRIDGIASDISDRLKVESQVRKLSKVVEQSPASVVITDIEGRIEYVNPRYCTSTGFSLEEVRGKCPDVHASGQTPKEVHEDLWQTILAGGIWQGELLNRRNNGELFWALEVIAPVFDSRGRVCNFVAIHEDISEKRRTEAELQRINRTLRVLSRCRAALVRAHNEAHLLETMCDVLLESGGYQRVWVGIPLADFSVQIVAQRGFDTPTLTGALASVRWDTSLYGQGPAGRAIRSGKAVVEHQLQGPEQAPSVIIGHATGATAIACLPLLAGSKVLGLLTLLSADTPAFDPAEMALLAELAEDLAYGLSNLRNDLLRQAHEAELHMMHRAIDASSDGIMVVDLRRTNTPLVYVNSAFERITGYIASEVLGRNARFLHGTDTEQSGLHELYSSIDAGQPARVELRTYRKDGSPFWSEVAIAPVRDGDGEIDHLVAVLTDITQRKQWENQLEYQATHDALTDLPNRLLLSDRITHAIANARREQSCVALMLLDLDRFKLVNDSLGHEAGDSVLKTIASRLLERLREGDTVARLGGDEFVVVANVHDEHGAAALAITLMQAIAEPLLINQQPIYPACSLGIALFPRDGDEQVSLLRNADAAMYRAKADGSNFPQFYAEELTVSTGRRLQLESALRQALAKQELHLHFQPKVRIDTGMLVGAEVLLRWQHPELGMISPSEFIPVAEDTGLILPIGRWVLEHTCQQIARWLTLELPVVPLAVNLSARQFAAPDLVGQIAQVLHDSGVPASLLQLELTESTLVHRPEQAAAMLTRLRALGIKLALDDFGTGYSSLSYLRRFPINFLKIDQSFVRDLVYEPSNATIALSVINLAHSLHMEVVAEGVETEAQLQFLRRHGCDQVQGYLTGRPIPAVEFQGLLGRTGRLIQAKTDNNTQRTLLLLDDEPNILNALRRVFAHEGYRILMTTSVKQAHELLALHEVGVILADQRMAEMSGTDFFRGVKQSFPNTVRMILSGYSDFDTLAAAINEGAIYKFLSKPWDDEQLREQIRDAFRYHQLIQGSAATSSAPPLANTDG